MESFWKNKLMLKTSLVLAGMVVLGVLQFPELEIEYWLELVTFPDDGVCFYVQIRMEMLKVMFGSAALCFAVEKTLFYLTLKNIKTI